MSEEQQIAADYKARVESCVSRNEMALALRLLQDFVHNLAPRYRKDVLLLCRREAAYVEGKIRGTSDDSEINAIASNVLEIAAKAEEQALVPPDAVILTKTSHASTPPKIDDARTTEDYQTKIDIVDSVRPEIVPLSSESFSAEEQQRRHWYRYRLTDNTGSMELVKAQGLTKNYKDGKFSISELNFSLMIGQITGIAGRNGSGKTTLLKLIKRELSPNGGQITFPALQSRGGTFRESLKNIYYIRQDIQPWLGSLRSNLLVHASANGVYGKDNADLVDEIMYRYDLTRYHDSNFATLSGGYRLRYELVKALIAKPKLLILDEPLASLDLISRQEFLTNLRQIAYAFHAPTAIVLTTQHLYDLDAIADQVIILENGKPLYVGGQNDASETPEDRIYEIVCNLPEATISRGLSTIGMRLISSSIDNHVVRSDRDNLSRGAVDILNTLGEAVVGIRDITKSARRFFVN